MPDAPGELAGFSVVVSWPVQWGDQDAYGHVNNTVYFRWVETARVKYLEQLEQLAAGAGESILEPILASISCNYRRQVKYPDTVRIALRVTRIGRSSISMEHKLWSESQQAIVADGQGTVVTFDYTANRSCPVPPEMRAAIAQLEGREFDAA
jgi:acyl-CoA thioester hydrolase